MVLIQAIMTTVPFVLLVIFGKDRPDKPPNASEEVDKIDLYGSVKQLVNNKMYLINMVCFSSFLGMSWTILTGTHFALQF